MNNTRNKTRKWFGRDESREVVRDEIQSGTTSKTDRRMMSASDASGSAFRSRTVHGRGSGAASSRPLSARSVAASLAGLIGLSVAAWGAAASAQADEAVRPALTSASTVASASLTSASGAFSQQVTASKYATASKKTPASKELGASKRSSASRQTGKSKAAERRDVKATIQTLVDNGYPGALAAKTDKDGNTVGATAGKGNLATGEAPPLDGEVRIGSNTKTFVAVVIMKMVEEGKVKLDEPIETYLPGLIKGQGVDGKKITVRQLLQHTSGLPETALGFPDVFASRNNYYQPRDILDEALTKAAQFAPGAKFTYTNTNYIVLGLLAERVAKRPIAEQIETKIVKPLGLKHTYMPKDGEKALRGKHPRGYHTRDNKPGKLVDITDYDTSMAWTAGAMVSTPSELNKFMQSIFDGSLLNQASISEMKKSVPMGDDGNVYGLGLIGHKLSCGVAWGHGGTFPGYQTDNAVGPDGTAAVIATTAIPSANAKDTAAGKAGEKLLGLQALDRAVCGK